MPRIELNTEINAPINVVFDLSRSIDFHVKSTERTGEKAIAGRTSGLINLNETVTWRAKHFGVQQKLTSKITIMKRPDIFVDEMTTGAFKSFTHQHLFLEEGDKTLLIDIFEFESPLGVLGRMANRLFLKKYMERLLVERNALLKEVAENGDWREFVSITIE
jgi:ligand-binding SRPBCC domain-containing protein